MRQILYVLITFIGIAFLGSPLLADTPKGFYDRFYIERNSAGEVVAIHDKSLLITKFTIAPYVELLKQKMREHILKLRSKDLSYQREIDSFVDEAKTSDKMGANPDDASTIRTSLYNLPAVDVESIFNNGTLKEALKKFELLLKDYMDSFNLTVVAKLDNPRFYYRRTVTYKAVDMALDFAKKNTSNIPVLNTVSYVLTRIEKMLRERIVFHQNMLMYYLENFSETELSMTKSEVDRAMSSIYEARISVLSYNESNLASATWPTYGFTKFFKEMRTVNTSLRNYTGRCLLDQDKIALGFKSGICKNNKHLILNFLNTSNQFSRSPSVAFDLDSKGRIFAMRTLMILAQIGLSYLNIPDIIKSSADNFINSMYLPQKLSEGALVAYFESKMMRDNAEIVYLQALNPFDIYTVK